MSICFYDESLCPGLNYSRVGNPEFFYPGINLPDTLTM